MRELTHLSLFSGIGGLDLAAEWAGFRTVGQCEWADYPRAVLEKHWPGLPRWRDIRTLTGDDFYEKTGLRTVTVLSGGFPCQPFSTAGKRRGKEDDRYLWPEMLRVIQEIRPRWVVGENVAGIVTLALDTVLSDLESIGYACQAVIIPACAVDAPHRRDRCAILAHANDTQTPRQREHGGEIPPEPKQKDLTYAVAMWPTPKSSDSKGTGPVGSASQTHDAKKGNLRGAVLEAFATPQARDYRTGQNSRFEDSNRSNNLNDQIGGQLNPTWVEWLMGFPIGWTDLNASETP